MRTSIIAATAISSILAVGCIQEEGPRIGHALPRADDVRVKLPDQAAASGSLGGDGAIGSTQLEALGDIADYYLVTRNVTRSLNAGAGWVLLVVHTVVQFPPTTIDGNVYTWGPHSDALDPSEWMLVVTENDGGASYDWEMRGRDKTTPGSSFETFISGHAVPGDTPHRGVGEFTLDFDAAERANPVDNSGQRGSVTVVYDLENRDGSDAFVEMHIVGVEPDEGGIDRNVEFDYAYTEALDTSGTFLFAVHNNLDDTPEFEDAAISSRWDVTGAGRAQISVSGGSLGDLEVSATECWDTSFRRVFYADDQQWAEPEGTEDACPMPAF